MAAILSLPRTPAADARLAERNRAERNRMNEDAAGGMVDDASGAVDREAAEALADLRRMMDVHAESRRQAAAFERLCRVAPAAETESAGVLVLPVVLAPAEAGQRYA